MKESHVFVAKAVAFWAILSLPGNIATFYFLCWGENDEIKSEVENNQTKEANENTSKINTA